jgi:hypothetical protein
MRQALLDSRSSTPDLVEGEGRVPIYLDLPQPLLGSQTAFFSDSVLRPVSRPASPPHPPPSTSTTLVPTTTTITTTGVTKSRPSTMGSIITLQPVPPHPPPRMPLPQIPPNASPAAVLLNGRRTSGGSLGSKRSSGSSVFSDVSDPFPYEGAFRSGDALRTGTWDLKRTSGSSVGAVSIASSGVFSPTVQSWAMMSPAR